jgi:hypothetical protein
MAGLLKRRGPQFSHAFLAGRRHLLLEVSSCPPRCSISISSGLLSRSSSSSFSPFLTAHDSTHSATTATTGEGKGCSIELHFCNASSPIRREGRPSIPRLRRTIFSSRFPFFCPRPFLPTQRLKLLLLLLLALFTSTCFHPNNTRRRPFSGPPPTFLQPSPPRSPLAPLSLPFPPGQRSPPPCSQQQ